MQTVTKSDDGDTRWRGPAVTPRQIGEYEIIEEIARGGMGIVWKARQRVPDRIVALKMILAGRLSSDHAVERFLIEAYSAGNLDHPNIVPIFAVGQESGDYFYTMKYITGESLDRHVRSNPSKAGFPAGPAAAAELLIKIAMAVHHAHQRGVLHRDLKPGNILLDERMEPFVTDFGLAKLLHGDQHLTVTGMAVGTPSYLSPEQAAGSKGLSTAVDVYGLGAVLYEMLTGRPPFRGVTVMDTIRRVIEDEPVPPHAIVPGLSRDLEAICLKCLEKQPARRYASAEALALDLRHWVEGKPVQAPAAVGPSAGSCGPGAAPRRLS